MSLHAPNTDIALLLRGLSCMSILELYFVGFAVLETLFEPFSSLVFSHHNERK